MFLTLIMARNCPTPVAWGSILCLTTIHSLSQLFSVWEEFGKEKHHLVKVWMLCDQLFHGYLQDVVVMSQQVLDYLASKRDSKIIGWPKLLAVQANDIQTKTAFPNQPELINIFAN